jgi:hypothetical protein
MAHWNEQRDNERLAQARAISLAVPFKELLGKFEKTGDIIYWDAFVREVRSAAPRPGTGLTIRTC